MLYFPSETNNCEETRDVTLRKSMLRAVIDKEKAREERDKRVTTPRPYKLHQTFMKPAAMRPPHLPKEAGTELTDGNETKISPRQAAEATREPSWVPLQNVFGHFACKVRSPRLMCLGQFKSI